MSEQVEETVPDEETNPDVEPVEPIEPDEPDEPEATPDAPPAGPSSEALMQAADKENRRYHAKLDRILGPDENRHECEACNGLGVKWGDDAPALELVVAEDAEPCPKCNAFGLTLTGSKQPGQETKPCAGCGGRGWREKIVPLEPVAQFTLPQPPVDTPIAGQYVPGKGFIPYGSTEPIPGSLTG